MARPPDRAAPGPGHPEGHDLRCDHIKFAEVIVPGVIEVKCRSARCGASPEKVVIHRFDVLKMELVETRTFKNPKFRKE